MSGAPSTSAPSKKKTAKAAEPAPPPFKPAKYELYDKQVVDYVKTATATNIWYYR